MKKTLPVLLRCLLLPCVLLLLNINSFATHIVGAELRYKWIGTTPADQTYQITVILYGDCSSTSGVFASLPSCTPQVCVYDGAALDTTLVLGTPIPAAGVEVTPVCPDSLAYTSCTSISYPIPGIKKFVYTVNRKLPHASPFWRFVYNGNNFASSSGRSGAITNLNTGGGSTLIQLIDTLNNSATNTRGHNSSPVLTVEPTPFFCGGFEDCYNPGANDIYDTSYIDEPQGDSLLFQLIAATNGTGFCGTVGGPASYLSSQCPGGPLCTGAEPLSLVACAPADFSFDSSTGQLCFIPTSPQRSVVVYNIEEYRNDTVFGIVNKVLVGTMQREMTFLVLPCTYTNPKGHVDSFAGHGELYADSVNYYGCANTGLLTLYVNPREADTSLHITVTATSLSTGFVFAVTGNGTDTPHASVTLNTDVISPGFYTFYLTYIDNHCPLTGRVTQAFTVQILPVPTIRDSLISPATCKDSAQYMIFPGGTGKPWTVKFWQTPPVIGDTFLVRVDSVPFIVNLAPGVDGAVIYTAISNKCAINIPIIVDTPRFPINGLGIDPDYCGASDGSIKIGLLHPGIIDSIRYSRDGVPMPRIGILPGADSTDTLSGLLAATYIVNIIEGLCVSDTLGPLTLVNPPFRMGGVTGLSPNKCGFCNGIDTIFRLHPDQLDTITYAFYPPGSTTPTYSTVSHFITSDSLVILSGLCEGIYTNFVVHTAGINVCADSCCTVPLQAPPIQDSFRVTPHYGCHGDTIEFTNRSSPPTELFYHWNFGDGTTSSIPSPTHIFTNTTNNTVIVELDVTNTKCPDTFKQTIFLNNYVHASYTMDPPAFVCQLSPVTFTNTSVGASPETGNPPTYRWLFGDGTIDTSFSPTHTFTNTNAYTVKLVAANDIPCYDTAVRMLEVDSISIISIQATDSVICRGQGITFKGIYTSIGDTGNAWSFGDANDMVNMNPVIHSYDEIGTHTVSLTALYRACPQESSSRNIYVIEQPDLYLGPDMAICPGGNPLTIIDERNAKASNTRWIWSTGDTTAGITVTKPGYYSVMVTKNGCSSYDTVWVQKDCYMDIPNVFTPNGDGTNDYFYPRQLLTKGLVKFKMDIYNRWGQLIFETTSAEGKGWDGKMNDVAQPEGVYVYLIDATYKDGQIEHHQGNVTILR